MGLNPCGLDVAIMPNDTRRSPLIWTTQVGRRNPGSFTISHARLTVALVRLLSGWQSRTGDPTGYVLLNRSQRAWATSSNVGTLAGVGVACGLPPSLVAGALSDASSSGDGS